MISARKDSHLDNFPGMIEKRRAAQTFLLSQGGSPTLPDYWLGIGPTVNILLCDDEMTIWWGLTYIRQETLRRLLLSAPILLPPDMHLPAVCWSKAQLIF